MTTYTPPRLLACKEEEGVDRRAPPHCKGGRHRQHAPSFRRTPLVCLLHINDRHRETNACENALLCATVLLVCCNRASEAPDRWCWSCVVVILVWSGRRGAAMPSCLRAKDSNLSPPPCRIRPLVLGQDSPPCCAAVSLFLYRGESNAKNIMTSCSFFVGEDACTAYLQSCIDRRKKRERAAALSLLHIGRG